MNILDYASYNFLYICGDIHGDIRTLVYNIKFHGIKNSVIIIAGDCGIGFERKSHYEHLYNRISSILEATNNILLLVRGNHDDPAYFDGTTIDFERMKCIPDYSVVCTAWHRTLCVGGAISNDRTQRLVEMREEGLKRCNLRPLYWENEAPSLNKQALNSLRGLLIDTVVTHTCPSFCYPIIKSGIENWLLKDLALKNDIDAERELMDDIYNHLIANNHPLQNWYYGHYHESHTEYINNVAFSLLNIQELKGVKLY